MKEAGALPDRSGKALAESQVIDGEPGTGYANCKGFLDHERRGLNMTADNIRQIPLSV
jgi:hypothetical protein